MGVVEPDVLLLRLTVDTPAVQRKLTELLVPSYMPHTQPGGVQLSRVVAMCRQNSGAALHLYAGVYRWVPLGAICKLVRLLAKCIVMCLDSEEDGCLVTTNTKGSRKRGEQKQDGLISKEDTEMMNALTGVMEA